MGLFDKVKKILFDEEEIDETLPIRTDEIEKEKKRIETEEKREPEEKRFENRSRSGGVIFHNNEVDEDTITEVKVPEEKPSSFAFPVLDDFDDDKEDTVQMRLKEDEFDRTQELERTRVQQVTRSKEDLLKEYNEMRAANRAPSAPVTPSVEPKKVIEDLPSHDDNKTPYKVPPVISPVFGVLDKNYDPDNYEETRQKITLSNSGSSTDLSERQFGPVSYNDQGIPMPKYHKETVIITNDPSAKNFIKEELLREKESMKEVNQIEEEIINSIINDEPETNTIEDAFEETKPIKKVSKKEEAKEEPIIEEEPVIELPSLAEEEEETDEVITGSPYDDLIDNEIEPTKDINDLIEETEAEEADVTIDAPKNIEENVNLDDTIETDLYNLIDSMYKDEE